MPAATPRHDPESYNLSWHIIRELLSPVDGSLVEHLHQSYNEFIDTLLPETIYQFNPIRIVNDYNEERNAYGTVLQVEFKDVVYNHPQMHENNGCTRSMNPHSARLRNMTYNSNMQVNLEITCTHLHGRPVSNMHHVVRNISIGKIPVMVKSKLCSLVADVALPTDRSHECPYDRGGYFIVNGSEKIIVPQERTAFNKLCCYRGSKTAKYLYSIEIKSVGLDTILMPKPFMVRLMRKANVLGNLIYVNCSRFRQDIPLFVIFRALGMESDRDIAETIVGDVTDPFENDLMYLLRPSLEECNNILTQSMALAYLAKYVQISGNPRELKVTQDMRIRCVNDALRKDLLPHIKPIARTRSPPS